MVLQRRLLMRLRNVWKKMRRRKCNRLFGFAVSFFLVLVWVMRSDIRRNTPHSCAHCTPIDVVYSWVNGSDPAFVAAAQSYDPTYDPARYDDKNELRYSLRSLELYAPWVRHVYIVTNGQIPHWLDLSYERVTVVPHEVLAPHSDILPTFSSAAIETFLHLIPRLSKRFLYLNDDIFLGAPLYPEDLYTDADGVRVYQAWMVPDCAEDCPWTYIGDGACDNHCNIAECQYDGGDCAMLATDRNENVNVETELVDKKPSRLKQAAPTKATRKNSTTRAEIRRFPQKKPSFGNGKVSSRNASSFKELMRHKNLTTLNELRRIVDTFNHHKFKTNAHSTAAAITGSATSANNASARPSAQYKSSKDVYSQSLIYTNMLLNRHYGFKPRNVLAHVGFLLDRDVLNSMHAKFGDEINATAAHRFRAPDDLQFSFAYYSFLMGETRTASVEEIFDEFDTDSSHTWSDREVRTFLTRMYPLPLDWSAVRFFEEVIFNCSRKWESKGQSESVVYSTLVYERYEDSNVPTITRDLVAKCPLLAEALLANFAIRPLYKFNINPKGALHNNFMMLTSNVTEVVNGLDKMRSNPRKFNCINDNLEPHTEDNELIRHLLEDFYLSFLPRRSKFELQPQYRNRFDNWQDYQRWRRRKRAALVIGYGACIVLAIFLMRFMCMHKAKCVRRYVQKL